MNFLQLDRYITGPAAERLRSTVKLQVQFYRKFSVPLFALIMAHDRRSRSASWWAIAAPWRASA